MNVLVTGAAGSIGSHVSQGLLGLGHRVVGLDNLNDYYSPARKRRNLQEVAASAPRPEDFHFHQGDIRDVETLTALFSTHAFEAVVHLAAMAGVRASVEDPELYLDVNLIGTLRLLDRVRDFQVGNFVMASTSSVYGNTERLPFEESDPCDRPLAPYPASKRAAEMLAYSYHHTYDLNVTALRFFTVYGPRGRPDMMAYKVLDSIFLGNEVPLYNGGNMHRDWTYVEDIVAGVIAAVGKPLGYEILNIGRGEPVLLLDFVRALEELAGKKANLVDAPMPSADIRYTYADIGKARRLLGYAPSTHFREGVRRLWDWYRTAVLETSSTPS